MESHAEIDARQDALERVVEAIGAAAVAVSGGVDSMTLATLAHRRRPATTAMFHAVSAAVPDEATGRVRDLAAREGWNLTVVDAGEFARAEYRANPVNRCYFCKTSLYGTIRPLTCAQILSGANLDDLGEYRPGLDAAREHGVRHPYIEAGIDKLTVRAIARRLGLGDIAELPAAPCLASRIETGIGVEADMLARVHAAERYVARRIGPRTVRCRVRAAGVTVELDAASLAALDAGTRAELTARIARLFEDRQPVGFAAYRVGSAFLTEAHGLTEAHCLTEDRAAAV
ncbi:MAG: adenine nucleotide alpha hydrolase [Alphaproteobacteria bacterium]|nr:adenine nucleotide alpha hydrolase [Alphaproteobacteria bacterium]